MINPSFFRVPGSAADLPLMIWPDNEGDMIVQVGRSHPFSSWSDKVKFASLVTDTLWTAEPITAAEYHAALGGGTWPDGRKAWEA